MSSTEQQIEQEIQDKGLNAPRLTPQHIDSVIASEHYFTAAQGDAKAQEDGAFINGSLNGAPMRPIPAALSQITFCVLILKNGYKITGVTIRVLAQKITILKWAAKWPMTMHVIKFGSLRAIC